MGEKDTTEKILESYNDVFADIVNVLVFKDKRRVDPETLKDTPVHAQYRKEEGTIHEEERDILKYWEESGVEIALCGIENQSKTEKYMPLRVIGYDGASYRSQLDSQKPVPVMTIVLYFGTDRRWTAPKTLKELVKIPEGLDDYVNDYKINVFEIGWLTDEQVAMFTSDFRIVANFFVNKRKNSAYIPDDEQEIQHVDEVLKLLSAMTGDDKYETLLNDGKGKVKNMCDVAERLVNIGEARGEARFAKLVDVLMQLGRTSDIKKAASDEEARKAFYREFGIVD